MSVHPFQLLIGVLTMAFGSVSLAAAAPAPAVAPTWLVSSRLEAKAGYADNVTLASTTPLSGAWLGGAGEASAFRKTDASRWSLFALGEITHFLGAARAVDDEKSGLLRAEWRRDWRSWRFTTSGRGFWQQSVLDFSADESAPVIIPVRVTAPAAEISVLRRWGTAFSTEFLGVAEERRYAGYGGSFFETRPALRLGFTHGRWEVSARAQEGFRLYRSRRNHTAGGRPLAGTRARWERPELQLKVLHQVRARTLTRRLSGVVFAQQVRDGASGFFDYTRVGGRLGLEWERGDWELRAEVEHERDLYRIQTVGTGIAPARRWASETSATFELTRELNDRWSLTCELSGSTNQSNLADFAYRQARTGLGLRREF